MAAGGSPSIDPKFPCPDKRGHSLKNLELNEQVRRKPTDHHEDDIYLLHLQQFLQIF